MQAEALAQLLDELVFAGRVDRAWSIMLDHLEVGRRSRSAAAACARVLERAPEHLEAAAVARTLVRAWCSEGERALHPNEPPWWRFHMGLALKHARRFADATATFLALMRELGPEPPVAWNLGLCATGAGRFDLSREAFCALRLDPRTGVGGRRRHEVRVGTHLLVGRGQKPAYEQVWVEPSSPCHGVVLNTTRGDLGADRGDVVLWDAQPFRAENETSASFPVLSVLRRGSFVTHRFRARQAYPGQLHSLNARLPRTLEIHVHTERAEALCAQCARSGGEHAAMHEASGAHVILTGKLAVGRTYPLEHARGHLEAAIRHHPGVTISVPSLYRTPRESGEAQLHEGLWHELDRLS